MPRLYICRNSSRAFIYDSGSPNSIFAISYTSTPTSMPAQALSFTPALDFASVLEVPEKYTNKNLQKTTKLTLESFVKSQKYSQL